jgi:hypothetical protein
MALVGTDHRRRAVAVTLIVIFVVALMGGVLAVAIGSGGSLAAAASSTQQEQAAAAAQAAAAQAAAQSAPQTAAAPGAAKEAAQAAAAQSAAAQAAAASSSNTGSGSGSNSVKLPASVKTHVNKALLQSSDFPPGWATAATAAATSRTSPWSKRLASCASVPASIAAIKPIKVNGPEFTSSDKTMAVEDSISVYPTAAEGKAAWKALASAKTPSCMNRIGSSALRTSVQDEAGSGATVGAVTIAALAPGSYEAGQTGYSVTIPLVSGGRQLTISSTDIAFVQGRYVHQLTFNGNGVQFTPLLEVHLVRQTEART